MDPNTLPTPNFNLPPTPNHESGGVNPNIGNENVPYKAENQNIERSASEVAPLPPPLSAVPPVPSIAAPSPAVPAPALPTQAQLDDLAADDNDLIEKEWVTKAKAIVDSTRTNPHEQNKQINKVKADYIKKRYNKDIKVSEE